jgi:predicted nucleotidyltransferase
MKSQETALAHLARLNVNNDNDEFFRRIIHRIVTESTAHYGDRIAAVYIHGSVHRGEAVRGVSDVDITVFIHDKRHDEDVAWRIATNDRLQAELPEFGWHWIPPATSVSVFSAFRSAFASGETLDSGFTVLRGRAWTYLLRDDATLIYGAELERDLPKTPSDREWARTKFELPRNTVRHAAGLPCVPNTPEAEDELRQWPLPKPEHLRLRKLARMAVLGGAYLLMAQNRFVSYKGADILPVLQGELRDWNSFLKATEDLYVVPKDTNVTPRAMSEYIHRLVAWMDWVAEQLEIDQIV